MRTITGPELTTLMGDNVAHFLKVEVQNGSGTYKDLTNLGGVDWVNGCSINCETIDTPISTANVEIKREHNGVIMSPLVSSSLNVNDAAAYSPLLDPGRTIRISVAVKAAGGTPSGGDWKELFLGRVDRVAWNADPIALECSDIGAWLLDTQVETEDAYGSGAGVAVETVMQSIITAWPSGVLSTPTLYTPSSPGWLLHEYKQDRVKVLEAVRALAQQIGFDCRFRYDASNVLRLTFWEPDRAKSTADATITPAQYMDVTQLQLALADIRNACKVIYRKTDDTVDSVTATDASSVAHFGRRYMEIQEAGASNIDSSTEAQMLADAAIHDLSDPIAEQEIKLFLFWPAQLGDLYTFTANGKHYDASQTLAVVGVRHDFKDGHGTTTLQTRGSVAGAYADWLRLFEQNRVLPQVATLLPTWTSDSKLSVSLTGNSITGSFKVAVSNTAYPTLATVRAATAVNGLTAEITFAGPFSYGDTIYVCALAYSGKDGTGAESTLAKVALDVPASRTTSAPVLTITIGNNQSSSVLTALASALVCAPSDAASIKWLASTSSQPSTASTASTGASVSSGAPLFSIADLGVALNLGDSVYLTVVYYNASSVLIPPGVQGKATRASLSMSKTLQWAATQFLEQNVAGNPGYQYATDEVTVGWISPSYDFFFYCYFVLPDNVTVTSVGVEAYRDVGTYGGVDASFFAASVGSAFGGNFATMAAADTAAWATYSAAVSQSSTGKRFLAVVELNSYDSGVVKIAFRSIIVVYTPANTQATI